ncbi:MAG: class I SAM-dependent methyltransferase [Proteobacteria bacterium]|nr:class I SAM-dependent methyltransferase [Candidatus Enterousia scatequi]
MHLTTSQKMYDNLAAGYRTYSQSRLLYLNTVDSVVKQYLTSKSSIIDFGSGDGVRIHNIAKNITTKLCLVENSDNMLARIKGLYPHALVLSQSFSDTNFYTDNKYDIATCLWNVLGHLGNEQQILTGLKNIKKSVCQNGIVILDVNNRHNISQYKKKAVRNIIKDLFTYKFGNGDIKFNISMNGQNIPSYVHIFNKYEIEKLIKAAGFVIKSKFYINYANGNIEKSPLFGQLCYILTVKKQDIR